MSIDIAFMRGVRAAWTFILSELGYGLLKFGAILSFADWDLFFVGVALVCCGFHVLVRAYRNAVEVWYPDQWIADLTDSNDIGRAPLYW